MYFINGHIHQLFPPPNGSFGCQINHLAPCLCFLNTTFKDIVIKQNRTFPSPFGSLSFHKHMSIPPCEILGGFHHLARESLLGSSWLLLCVFVLCRCAVLSKSLINNIFVPSITEIPSAERSRAAGFSSHINIFHLLSWRNDQNRFYLVRWSTRGGRY